GDGEAMLQRLDGEFLGGEQVPHHVRPLQIGIEPVTVVVRQAQRLAGEFTCLQRLGKALTQGGVLRRVGDDRFDRLALAQQFQLPQRQLAVVGAATIQTDGKQQGNPAQAQAVDQGGVELRHRETVCGTGQAPGAHGAPYRGGAVGCNPGRATSFPKFSSRSSSMRGFVLALFVSSLAGCSLWMPKPDPTQAWIELAPHQETDLQALAVDGRRLDDDRYFQVQPGSRTLDMRYRFQV